MEQTSIQSMLALSRRFYRRREYDKARTTLLEAQKEEPENVEVLQSLKLVNRALEKAKAAKKESTSPQPPNDPVAKAPQEDLDPFLTHAPQSSELSSVPLAKPSNKGRTTETWVSPTLSGAWLSEESEDEPARPLVNKEMLRQTGIRPAHELWVSDANALQAEPEEDEDDDDNPFSVKVEQPWYLKTGIRPLNQTILEAPEDLPEPFEPPPTPELPPQQPELPGKAEMKQTVAEFREWKDSLRLILRRRLDDDEDRIAPPAIQGIGWLYTAGGALGAFICLGAALPGDAPSWLLRPIILDPALFLQMLFYGPILSAASHLGIADLALEDALLWLSGGGGKTPNVVFCFLFALQGILFWNFVRGSRQAYWATIPLLALGWLLSLPGVTDLASGVQQMAARSQGTMEFSSGLFNFWFLVMSFSVIYPIASPAARKFFGIDFDLEMLQESVRALLTRPPKEEENP